MMVRSIEYEQLKPFIKIVFKDDNKIFDYYDPNVNPVSVEEIIQDIYKKVGEYADANIYGVYDKSKPIGYIVSKGNRLISFGLAMEYRFRKYLNNFFNIIKGLLGSNFYCLLWTRNIRATKWLVKNGMKAIYHDNQIVKVCPLAD